MLFKAKKKRPIDVFSTIKKPHLEEAYIKFPGKALKPISKKRDAHHTKANISRVNKLIRKYGLKYMAIHTHPDGVGLPSPTDLEGFLFTELRTSVIVPLSREDREALGYFVMRKNKGYKAPLRNEETLTKIKSYFKEEDAPLTVENLKDLSKEYNFSCRYFPVENSQSKRENREYLSDRHPLETRLAAIAIAPFLFSILINLSTITGKTISELPYHRSNILGIWLFLIGLCLSGLMLLAFPEISEK